MRGAGTRLVGNTPAHTLRHVRPVRPVPETSPVRRNVAPHMAVPRTVRTHVLDGAVVTYQFRKIPGCSCLD